MRSSSGVGGAIRGVGRLELRGTLACDGHRDAEDEALAKEKHYRLIPILLNA
jgi:hypothetical protein